jgi:hypothetical protein
MSRFVRSLGALMAIMAILAFAGPTAAATTEECRAHIDALAVATSSAEFPGKNPEKSEAGLLQKLSDASVKLDEGKLADAEQKLVQFRDQVVLLQQQGKIAEGDALTLIAGANDAIGCLQELQLVA